MAMTVLLPILMAYMIIGQKLHEWLGTVMLLLFIAHHILNFRWIKNLFRGRYTVVRIFTSLINILLVFDMICLAVSGIIISSYVFDFLNIHNGMVFARQQHMFSAYWGFMLMSVHLGAHWNFFVGSIKRITHSVKESSAVIWIFRIIVLLISIYGIYLFIIQNITDYLFLKTASVFFDFDKEPLVFFCEYIAMIILFAAIAYYLNKCFQRILINKERLTMKKFKNFIFLITALVFLLSECGSENSEKGLSNTIQSYENSEIQTQSSDKTQSAPKGFVLIKRGTFEMGGLRVYRGGDWNDFAKNMRCAYRATLAQDKASFNIGLRLVCGAVSMSGSVSVAESEKK